MGLRPSLCKPPWGASGFGAPEMTALALSAWQARSRIKIWRRRAERCWWRWKSLVPRYWGLSGRLRAGHSHWESRGLTLQEREPCTPRIGSHEPGSPRSQRWAWWASCNHTRHRALHGLAISEWLKWCVSWGSHHKLDT